MSRFFVEKAFSAKAKEFGDQIVSDIKEMFIEKLKVSTWMDKSVIKLAIEKVRLIRQKIGYPSESPNIMDPPALQTYYESVDISPSKFFGNALEMSRFEVSKEWSSLGKPVDRDQWGVSFEDLERIGPMLLTSVLDDRSYSECLLQSTWK